MARKLRADGRSFREIGEALNVGASTVRDHLIAKAG
jgi:DNA-binding CsgD family transcriptional regulator